MWIPSKLQAVAVAVLSPLAAPVGDLSFHPEVELVLDKKFEVDLSMELDSISVTLNGDDMSDQVQLDGVELEANLKALVSDEYRAVADGRPLKLVRVFEELVVEYDSGDEQGTESLDDLEGVAVLFSWNEELGEYDVSFADESGANEDILPGLLEDMDFRALLPRGDVDEGESWEVETKGIMSVLFPGLALKNLGQLADGGDEIPDGVLEQLERLPDGLEMTCTFAGMREQDGVALGVIEVVLEGDSRLDLSSVLAEAFDLPAEADADIKRAALEFSLEGEGELLWNIEAGHMVAYTMESELEIGFLVSASVDVQGSSFDVEGDVLFLGELTWRGGLAGE